MADTKWSQFPSAADAYADDEVVGIKNGQNTRFSFARILALIRQNLSNFFVPTSSVGVADGVASLDSNGKVPSGQLPSSTGPEPATATPLMDGTGAVGSSTKYAREDHEHPADTNKQNKITASGILKGDGQGGVSAATPGTDYQEPLTAGTDYAIPAQLDGKANPGQIGYPESGTTATRNYSAGEYICWNGLTYTANQAISSGTTLSAGTGGNLTECVGGGFNSLNAVSAKVTPFDVSSNSYVDVSIGYGIIFCTRYANGQYVTRVLFEIIAGGNPVLLMDSGTQTGKVTAAKQSNGVVRISSSMTVTINCIAVGI